MQKLLRGGHKNLPKSSINRNCYKVEKNEINGNTKRK